MGFLHIDNYGKKSVVFDLMEPFRILGDRAALLIFTGRRAQKDFFEPVAVGIALSKEGWAFFLSQYNERLDKTIRCPVQGKPGLLPKHAPARTKRSIPRWSVPIERLAASSSRRNSRGENGLITGSGFWPNFPDAWRPNLAPVLTALICSQ